MSREDPQLKIRLPAELKSSIEMAAIRNRRSINAEVVARLEESVLMEGDDDIYEMTTEISKEKLIVDPEGEYHRVYSVEDVHDAIEAAFKLLGAKITPEKVAEMKAKRTYNTLPSRRK